MRWFRKKREEAKSAEQSRASRDAIFEHLDQFVTSRRGVEAWIEEPTNFNKPSILLVAADGESTRRAIPSVHYGYDFADQHDLPAYDAGVVPYPQRMRDYGLRQRKQNR